MLPIKRSYGYQNFAADIRLMTEPLRLERFEAIAAVSRGGLTFAHFLAVALDIRNVFSITSRSYEGDRKIKNPALGRLPDLRGFSRVLIADDIVDSGETMIAVLGALRSAFPEISCKTAAIFQKQNAAFEADFFARKTEEWIEFFWETDPIRP